MPEGLTLAIIVIGFLVLLLFSLNFKIARENEAHVVERIGQFYKIVKGPALFFNVPLLDRVVQVVPLKQLERNIKIEDTTSKTIHHAHITYQISDIKMFVYATLDSEKSLKEYIVSHMSFEQGMTQTIEDMIHKHAESLGIEVLEIVYK